MTFNRIGVVGAGVMGEALIASLLRSGVKSSSIVIREKRPDRASEMIEKYGVVTANLTECDLLFFSVKPQDADSTLAEIINEISAGALLVSLLAGTRTEKIETALGNGTRVIRVMPNTPLLVGEGATAIASGKRAKPTDIEWIIRFFSQSGVAIEVTEEKMDAVTATSGSGPAYFFKLVESMIAAAKRLGLSEAEAKTLAEATLVGAAKMVAKSDKDVTTLRANVTSPNGTTAAAIATLENSNFEELIYQAMKSARDRSAELSQ